MMVGYQPGSAGNHTHTKEETTQKKYFLQFTHDN